MQPGPEAQGLYLLCRGPAPGAWAQTLSGRDSRGLCARDFKIWPAGAGVSAAGLGTRRQRDLNTSSFRKTD